MVRTRGVIKKGKRGGTRRYGGRRGGEGWWDRLSSAPSWFSSSKTPSDAASAGQNMAGSLTGALGSATSAGQNMAGSLTGALGMGSTANGPAPVGTAPVGTAPAAGGSRRRRKKSRKSRLRKRR